MFDLDLITIGNLNQVAAGGVNSSNGVSTANSNGSKPVGEDDVWYPVPIQSAVDYYEQLDPLLPTQYELLLKQLMRMQAAGTPSGIQPSVASGEPVGWKQVWDCFYDMAETKLSGEIESAARNGNTVEELM